MSSELERALEVLRSARALALIGASAAPGKYGHKVFSTLKDHYRLLLVNPKRTQIEGVPCHPSYGDLPEPPDAVIVALAPEVTESVVPRLLAAGAPLLWLPPECFTDEAVAACERAGVPVLHDVCPVAAMLALQRLQGQPPPGGTAP